jgi:hypothetical protein
MCQFTGLRLEVGGVNRASREVKDNLEGTEDHGGGRENESGEANIWERNFREKYLRGRGFAD